MKNEEKNNWLNEVRLEMYDKLQEFRCSSNERYAIKLIEKIVFALVGLILVGVMGALIKLVLIPS